MTGLGSFAAIGGNAASGHKAWKATTRTGPTPPLFVLLVVYGVVLLMLFQAVLNLFFGPSVGSRVLADLMTSFVRYLARILSLPLEAIRRAMSYPPNFGH